MALPLQLPEQMTPQVKSKMLEMPLIGDMCETPNSGEDYNKAAMQWSPLTGDCCLTSDWTGGS